LVDQIETGYWDCIYLCKASWDFSKYYPIKKWITICKWMVVGAMDDGYHSWSFTIFVFMDEFSWNKTNRTLVIIMDEVIIKCMHKPFIYIAELPRYGLDRTGRGGKNNNTLPKFCTGRFVSIFTPALHKRSTGGAHRHTHSAHTLSLVESAIVLSFWRLVFINSWVKLLRTRSGGVQAVVVVLSVAKWITQRTLRLNRY
jgi:hypothetical protein